jgi:hypothetical protein
MSVLGTTALCHACGTQAAFTELTISETGFSKREVDIASPRRRLQIQVDGLSPYAANLCPLSRRFEFAGFREDFGESIGELLNTMLRSAVRQ